MNALLEIFIIASVVGGAALFAALRVIKALRGGRPSCCSDAGEPDPMSRTTSCADADTSYCAGCTGCGPRPWMGGDKQ